MPELTILTPANPILRAPTRKISALTPKVQALIDDMIETMRSAPGVGLAAPQVGASLRLIVVEYSEPVEEGQDPVAPQLYVLVNPEIVRRSREVETAVEACLSVPGYAGEVERHTAITVKGLNRKGDAVRIKAQGWLARIFQHEIDHLEGVLFIDRASQVWAVEEQDEQAPRQASPTP